MSSGMWDACRIGNSGKPGGNPVTPDQAGVEVELRDGVNQLLIQVTHQGDRESLYARFLDPHRQLVYPEGNK